jgi:hypothetical protein
MEKQNSPGLLRWSWVSATLPRLNPFGDLRQDLIHSAIYAEYHSAKSSNPRGAREARDVAVKAVFLAFDNRIVRLARLDFGHGSAHTLKSHIAFVYKVAAGLVLPVLPKPWVGLVLPDNPNL